jgi:hypothetical protein
MWNKIILPLQQEESQLNLNNIKAKVILHFILLIAMQFIYNEERLLKLLLGDVLTISFQL